MKRSATFKLHTYLGLVAALLVAAFALRKPEMLIVASPFAVLLVIGLSAIGKVPGLDVAIRWSRARVIEGEELVMRVTVRADRDVQLLELAVVLPDGLSTPVPGLTLTRLEAGERRTLELPIRPNRWGLYTSVRCAVRGRSPLGLFQDEATFGIRYELRVYPRSEKLRGIVAPRGTQPFAGNLVARAVGSGVEFAEILPFQPGNELRHVNWRATARRGEMWVNAQHPERNADVVLFLDMFAGVGSPDGGTLDLTVRAAAALAARYLQHRDRVGVIGFGGTLQWLIPGSGERQLYQIVESLITTQLSFSYAWKDVSVIPAKTLPPQALVIALTPLIDKRSVQALFDLLRRKFDLTILDLSPEAFLPPATTETARLARRIWRLDREVLLGRYRQLGGAVISWSADRPLEAAIEEVTRFRRHARIVSAS